MAKGSSTKTSQTEGEDLSAEETGPEQRRREVAEDASQGNPGGSAGSLNEALDKLSDIHKQQAEEQADAGVTTEAEAAEDQGSDAVTSESESGSGDSGS